MILQYYMEDSLLELAKRNKIDPENYSIPTDPEEFHGFIVRGNNEFQRFLQDLIKTTEGLPSHLASYDWSYLPILQLSP